MDRFTYKYYYQANGQLMATYNSTDGYYEPVITMKADYYAFGMLMPDRHDGVSDTRHLFNGMEHDMEVSGEGNSYTTEFRQYDPRLGRWKSLDPLMGIQPHFSLYQAFNNNPIYFVDPLGLKGEDWYEDENGALQWFDTDVDEFHTAPDPGSNANSKVWT